MKLFFLPLFFFSLSVAQGGSDCREEQGPIPYRYCIHKTPGSQNADVLYYLHGGGGNEHQWESSSSGIRDAWAKSGHQAPVVITVSFGLAWFLVEKNSLETSRILSFFLSQVMPAMEKKALGGPAQRRMLMGSSMGGFNAFQLLLNAPPTTFQKVAIVCGAFINLSPWASEKEIEEFARKIGVPARDLREFREIVQAFVPDEATWLSRVSPLDLALTRFRGHPAKILVAGNSQDAHFFEGSRLLAAAFRAGGVKVEEKIWPGYHCELDSAALADFLKL
jgi:acetyl esterase/lipase